MHGWVEHEACATNSKVENKHILLVERVINGLCFLNGPFFTGCENTQLIHDGQQINSTPYHSSHNVQSPKEYLICYQSKRPFAH